MYHITSYFCLLGLLHNCKFVWFQIKQFCVFLNRWLSFMDLLCNVLHHLMFLLEEYIVFALASSVTRNPLFKICSPVMYCSKEMNNGKLTYKLATELFTSLRSYTGFHVELSTLYSTSYSWITVTIYFTTKNPVLQCTWHSCTNDNLHSYTPDIHFMHYSYNQSYINIYIYSPTDARNRFTNCTFVFKTPTCFGAKMPTSGSLKYRGAKTLKHKTRNKFYF